MGYLYLYLIGIIRVGRYQKNHSPADTHPGHQTSFISFLHLTMIHSILLVQFTYNSLANIWWAPFSKLLSKLLGKF